MDYEMTSESNNSNSSTGHANQQGQGQARCPYRPDTASFGAPQFQPGGWGPPPVPFHSAATPSAYWPAQMPVPYHQMPAGSGPFHRRSASTGSSYSAAQSTQSSTTDQQQQQQQQQQQPLFNFTQATSTGPYIQGGHTGIPIRPLNDHQNREPQFPPFPTQMPHLLYGHRQGPDYAQRYLPQPNFGGTLPANYANLQMPPRTALPPASPTHPSEVSAANRRAASYSYALARQAQEESIQQSLDFDSDDEDFDASDDETLAIRDAVLAARRENEAISARLAGVARGNPELRATILAAEQQRDRERAIRRAELFNLKLVASQAAIAALEKVDIKTLSEDKRVCAICYNDFGVKTPDGDVEVALRLPKCKHVFGDVCLKKWLEDSDTCPFCRDKLPSEPKRKHRTAASMHRHMYMTPAAYMMGGASYRARHRDPAGNLVVDPWRYELEASNAHIPRRFAVVSGPLSAADSSSANSGDRRRPRVRTNVLQGPGVRLPSLASQVGHSTPQERASRARSNISSDDASESRDGPRSITPHPATLDVPSASLNPSAPPWSFPEPTSSPGDGNASREPTGPFGYQYGRFAAAASHNLHRNPYTLPGSDSDEDGHFNWNYRLASIPLPPSQQPPTDISRQYAVPPAAADTSNIPAAPSIPDYSDVTGPGAAPESIRGWHPRLHSFGTPIQTSAPVYHSSVQQSPEEEL